MAMLALERLLVPLDFSDASKTALHRGADLARRTGADLHVFHVVPGFEPVDRDAFEDLDPDDQDFYRRVWDRADFDLTRLLTEVGTDDLKVRRVLSYGLPSSLILEYADDQDIDLIVMGTHGRRGLRRFMLGSVAEEVIRRAEIPVLVVPEGASGQRPFMHVLAPTDFSLASRMALPIAADLADRYGARLDLLHAVEPIPFLGALTGVRSTYDLLPELRTHAEAELTRIVQDGEEPAFRRSGRYLMEGKASEVIPEFVARHGVDLVVMAKHGLHGVERLVLGSVTERVLRAAPCSVLAVPMDDD